MATAKLVEYEDAPPEVRAVVAMAAETNSLANGYRVPVDERFK